MKLSLIFPALLCVLLFSGTGCESMAGPLEVDVSIENKSSRDIENVRARFGDYACSWGKVGRTFKAIHGQYSHPITAETELHWDVEGRHKMQKFDLRKTYPPGKRGRLSFIVFDDRAEVSFSELSPAK